MLFKTQKLKWLHRWFSIHQYFCYKVVSYSKGNPVVWNKLQHRPSLECQYFNYIYPDFPDTIVLQDSSLSMVGGHP